MPTIVEPQSSYAEMFSAAMGVHANVVASLDELKRNLADDVNEFVIVLGPSVDLEAAASLADTLRVTRPATSVILIRRRVDTSVLAEALRSGMREVIEERDLAGLGQAVLRAGQVWEAVHGPVGNALASHRGRQVTVFSPKGGVGKTTLAVNLALALSREENNVCLVDLDLGFGDVAITLQLFPARTLADAIPLEAGLDVDSLDSLLTPHRDGIHALVAPVQPDAKDSIHASLVGKVLRLLKSKYDYVVIDTAPSFDEHVLQAIDETDELLLVTTLDVPTLKNVKIAVETLDLLNFPNNRRHLILNRADDKVGLTAEKVESTLGMPIAASIPTSPQVASSTNAGEPILVSLPRHAVSKAISDLAAQLRPSLDVPGPGGEDPERPNRAAPKRGLLRRNGR
jgi:pilus assembly protein CpaE